jgi:hypothetical protein
VFMARCDPGTAKVPSVILEEVSWLRTRKPGERFDDSGVSRAGAGKPGWRRRAVAGPLYPRLPTGRRRLP